MSSENVAGVLRIAIIDPNFDDHTALASEARSGSVEMHYRVSGAEALRLARGREFDAWIVAAELDDMQGRDFVDLLRERVAAGMTAAPATTPPRVLVIGDAGSDGIGMPLSADAIREAIVGRSVAPSTSWWQHVPALPLGMTAAMMAVAMLVVG